LLPVAWARAFTWTRTRTGARTGTGAWTSGRRSAGAGTGANARTFARAWAKARPFGDFYAGAHNLGAALDNRRAAFFDDRVAAALDDRVAALADHDAVVTALAHDHPVVRVPADHYRPIIHDHPISALAHNHRTIHVNAVCARDHTRLIHDHRAVADHHRPINDRRRHEGGRDGPNRLDRPGGHNRRRRGKQRLAVAQAVEIQSIQTCPVAFKDHQRATFVPAPQFADLVAALVDDAELVVLAGLGRQVEVHLHVQILLRAGLGRGFAAAPSRVQFGHGRNMPGRCVFRHWDRLLCGDCRDAKQQRRDREEDCAASHPDAP
jgi:hypothetical protein